MKRCDEKRNNYLRGPVHINADVEFQLTHVLGESIAGVFSSRDCLKDKHTLYIVRWVEKNELLFFKTQ